VVAACSSSLPEGARPTLSLYCDNYLIYAMCVQDYDGDGVTDVVYFEDTREIFMYQEGWQNRNRNHRRNNLTWHRCPEPMDEDLLTTTSRMFYIDESTTLLEKTDIKGSLLIHYIRLMPDVTACTLQNS